MKNLLTLIILFALANNTNAQANYNFKSRNSIGYANTVFHIKDALDPKQNKHNIVYQRIINRRTTLIFNYSFSKSKMHFNQDKGPSMGRETTDTISGTTDVDYGFYAKEGDIYYKTTGFSIGIRKFIRTKGSIAPYGSFIEIKAGHEKLSRTPKDSLQYYNQDKRLYDKFPNLGMDHLSFINFQVGVGSTRAVTKNLSFTWLLNMTLNIPAWKNSSEQQTPNDTRKFYVLNDDEYFFSHASRVHQTNNILNLNIGLNYSF